MKKIFVVFVALCAIPLSVSAKAIDEARAREVATRFFFGNFATKADYQNLTLVWDGSDLTSGTKSSSSDGFEFVTPSFYTYNRYGGGYVFISGDDSVEPVIGYSLDGEFNPDDMPPALAWWLEGVKKTIDRNRTVDAVASYDVQLAWKFDGTRASTGAGSYDSGIGGKQLDTPQWNQGTPFNDDVPAKTSGTENCPCGCVATAMSELMRFYSWPAEPEDLTIQGYTDKYDNVIGSRDLSSRKYDWANMPLTYSLCQTASLSVQSNIAELLADIGASVQMYYGNSGSGASSEKIVYSMGTYFKFNKAANIEYRDSYTAIEWVNKMVKSIDEGHPMLAGGTSSTGGGHQFIVDGYDANHLLRFNFGWGKSFNGYWAVGMNEYAIEFSAIFDLYPDKNASTAFGTPNLVFNYMIGSTTVYDGFNLNGTIVPNNKFTINCRGLSCTGPGDFIKPYMRLGLKSKDGNVTSISGSTSYADSIKVGYVYQFSISGTIDRDIKLGDRIVFQYSPSYSGPWSTVRSIANGNMISEYPLFPYAFIDLPKECQAGSTFDLTLKNAPYRWYKSATWYVLEPGNSSETSVAFAQKALESEDGNSFTFSKAGMYKVRVVVKDPETNSIIDNISATISVK